MTQRVSGRHGYAFGDEKYAAGNKNGARFWHLAALTNRVDMTLARPFRSESIIKSGQAVDLIHSD
jgi:hypothetical protein